MPDRMGVAAADQHHAATVDTVDAFWRMVPALETMLGGQPRNIELRDPRWARFAAGLILPAISAGVKEMCPHTGPGQPIMFNCDPPVVLCRRCLVDREELMHRIRAMGFRYENLCDRCGVEQDGLTPVVMTVAHITILAHVCDTCKKAVPA